MVQMVGGVTSGTPFNIPYGIVGLPANSKDNADWCADPSYKLTTDAGTLQCDQVADYMKQHTVLFKN